VGERGHTCGVPDEGHGGEIDGPGPEEGSETGVGHVAQLGEEAASVSDLVNPGVRVI
jgi:hypothetical protein